MKNTGSNLATVTGLILLLVLIFAAAYLRLPVLIFFLTALLIFSLISWLWSFYATKKIEISIEENSVSLFPEQKGSLFIKLSNSKFLPVIWLDLNLNDSGSAVLETIDHEGLKKHLTWLMPYQKLSFSIDFTAKRRGILSIGSSTLKSGDGFGLSTREKKVYFNNDSTIIIYPRIIDADPSLLLSRLKELENSKSGFYADRTFMKSTRPYSPSDSFRDINWRSMARGGDTLVNIYERMAMQRLCFVLDIESFVYKELVIGEDGKEKVQRHIRRDEFEFMISLIASLSASMKNREVLISMVIPAYKGNDPVIFSPASAEFQIRDILNILARIDYEGEETETSFLTSGCSFHMLGRILIAAYSGETATIKTIDDNDTGYILYEGSCLHGISQDSVINLSELTHEKIN